MLNYGSSDSTKSLASDIATVSEPRLMPHVRRVREVVCALVSDASFRAVAVPVFLRILSYSVTHLSVA